MFTSWKTLGALDCGPTDSLNTGRLSEPTTMGWTSDSPYLHRLAIQAGKACRILDDLRGLNCTVASSRFIVALNGRQKLHATASLEWFLHADTRRQEQRSYSHHSGEPRRIEILAGSLLSWRHDGSGSRGPDPTA